MVDFSKLLGGERTKSRFELKGDYFLQLLEAAKDEGDTRIHYHQLEAVLRTNGMLLEDHGKRLQGKETGTIKPVLIVSPTGSGKSGMIVLLPYILKAKKVLILTPSKIVSRQLGISFGKGHGDKSFFEMTGILSKEAASEILEPVKIIEKGEDIKDRLPNLVIVNAQKFGGRSETSLSKTVQSLLYRNEEIVKDVEKFFAQFDLLIVDEAHHYPAPTWENIVNTFSIPSAGMDKKIVFLTATPFRKENGVDVPILKDIDKRICHRILPSDLEGKFVRRIEFNEGTEVEQLPNDIEKYFNEQLEEEPRFPPQAMIIVRTSKEALKYEGILNGSAGPNYAVAIYKGRDIDDEQRTNDFTAGKHRVAIVCGLLKEGYDNPKVTLCVILRKIGSQTLFSQFVGRCMRINRAVEGEETDKSKGRVLSYAKFRQQKMWEQRERLAEKDPIEVEDDEEDGSEENEEIP